MNEGSINCDPQEDNNENVSGYDAGRELYRINVDEQGEHVSTTFFIYSGQQTRELTFMRSTGRLVR